MFKNALTKIKDSIILHQFNRLTALHKENDALRKELRDVTVQKNRVIHFILKRQPFDAKMY